MLKKELIYLATAIMFFTRIPIPAKLPYSEQIMNQSQKYFSWVGLVVGICNALFLYLGMQLFDFSIAIILMMIGNVLLTGAFHEDGFIDVCDSFGGGYGKEKILTIMKDSRVGAYGVIGIILLFGLKFFTISALLDYHFSTVLLVLIFAHTSSRFLSGTMIYTHQYVRDIDQTKSKPLANKPLDKKALFISFLPVILVSILLKNPAFIGVFLFAFLGKIYLGWYFKKHIGGYTGDCLGTVQQVCEVLIYLGTLLVWKYIS
ncbi:MULTISPECIES: adenosylcobinamide-GDP ribazoletransferase [Weeksella]|uniref:Adenosylcobinamide-GDP ribazoletransferase n=1 Tax=Weeksella virosa (strain ATCC 43766 / DSM 16922 / JCM 21250 / CCUG 30538 / CDC 9751 / IAM 14551 / NBRC 16016 / NCTC 11634 / CL345/78) TaxID=865938 RepID=F0P1D2_WEEVC|nr:MULTISPECIES: adenosylcobinamide-GDP ribazoletransferase [Weeksella]ADX68646.1 Cobalamin synthase [Weeksella virosa DSM 16922]MDK7375922.1 adenosylcobinamide-GDP ribazoletransferase [Weeksella virosa]MDK7675785.1 adenosylcobinamide-GDP ribazoletransferase [Weeksella virosa]OFM85281.1 cobalamin synthase [Weeksella sp. HMSC059D05]SUP54993.1 cobalamin synthase [Weeksella virosa]